MTQDGGGASCGDDRPRDDGRGDDLARDQQAEADRQHEAEQARLDRQHQSGTTDATLEQSADDRQDETEGAGEMTDPIPFKPVDESIERRKLADEAKELLDNKAFTTAILALRKRCLRALMELATADEQDDVHRAKISALEAIPQELQISINDQKMHEARKK